MRLMVVCDANEESGVGQVVYDICGPTLQHFHPKNYGDGLSGLGVVLMCRDPELNFKRRIRFSRKEKTIDMDVMLDLTQMRQADHDVRKRIICERLIEEIPAVVRKYSITDFDDVLFEQDLKAWLTGNFGSQPTAQ
jgi:hypothetical protein